jgi:hypothetical protein
MSDSNAAPPLGSTGATQHRFGESYRFCKSYGFGSGLVSVPVTRFLHLVLGRDLGPADPRATAFIRDVAILAKVRVNSASFTRVRLA